MCCCCYLKLSQQWFKYITCDNFRLINYCEDNSAYIGAERMGEEDEVEDLMQRLAAVQLIDGVYMLLLSLGGLWFNLLMFFHVGSLWQISLSFENCWFVVM